MQEQEQQGYDLRPPNLADFLKHLRRTHSARTSVDHSAEMSQVLLASHTGLSHQYVAKLEQGKAGRPSLSTVHALEKALRLGPQQAEHFELLAGIGPADHMDAIPDFALANTVVSDDQRKTIDLLTPHLCAFVDTRWTVVHANPEYRRIFELAEGSNIMEWFFLSERSRTVMRDWESEARLTVAWFRSHYALAPRSPHFESVLNACSVIPEFREIWHSHEIVVGRRTPYMRLYDPAYDRNLNLATQVYRWPDRRVPLQLYLGVLREAGEETSGSDD